MELLPGAVALSIALLSHFIFSKNVILVMASEEGLAFGDENLIKWGELSRVFFWPSLLIYIAIKRDGSFFFFPIESPFKKVGVNESLSEKIANFKIRKKRGMYKDA
ncbi:MAG: hypothetical protein KDC79_09900 [Cyclobacteriaceae bacterium]|nr:hypothetical protein [Cyclobacteriaceae bacterium]